LAWALVALAACGGTTSVKPADLAGPCKKDSDCKTGLHCSSRGFEGTCTDMGGALGDSCGGDQLAPCGAGLTCYGVTSRTCVDPESFRGQPCAADWQCPPELGCVYGADGGTCMDPGVGIANVDVDCASRQCPTGLVCNQGFDPPRCRLAGGPGDVCFRGAEVGAPGTDCADELVCNWALSTRAGSGLCAPPGAAGAACLRDEECAVGLACVRADGGDSTCE